MAGGGGRRGRGVADLDPGAAPLDVADGRAPAETHVVGPVYPAGVGVGRRGVRCLLLLLSSAVRVVDGRLRRRYHRPARPVCCCYDVLALTVRLVLQAFLVPAYVLGSVRCSRDGLP